MNVLGIIGGFLKGFVGKLANKDFFYGVVIVGLIVFFLMQGCGDKKHSKDLEKQIENYQKEILKKDSVKKEADGQYAKLVDYFKTEGDLMKELKDQNGDLAKLIKKQDEKLLSISTTVATFKSQMDKGIKVDMLNNGTEAKFTTIYPGAESGQDWFIRYDGHLFTQTGKLDGAWTFNKIKFNVILTEQPDGMWKQRIVGPEFLEITDLKVNSLPKKDYVAPTEKNIHFLLGAGYRTQLNMKSNAVTLNAGISWKNKVIILTDVSTGQQVGLTIIKRFN